MRTILDKTGCITLLLVAYSQELFPVSLKLGLAVLFKCSRMAVCGEKDLEGESCNQSLGKAPFLQPCTSRFRRTRLTPVFCSSRQGYRGRNFDAYSVKCINMIKPSMM